MLDSYPNAEQIWYIRDLFYREQSKKDSLTDEEVQMIEKIRPFLRQTEGKLTILVDEINNIMPNEMAESLRLEMDPFQRDGELFMGSSHFAEYGCNRLHERLRDALSIVGGLQQGGLQGHHPDEEKIVNNYKEELKEFLIKLSEKLGITGISFKEMEQFPQ